MSKASARIPGGAIRRTASSRARRRSVKSWCPTCTSRQRIWSRTSTSDCQQDDEEEDDVLRDDRVQHDLRSEPDEVRHVIKRPATPLYSDRRVQGDEGRDDEGLAAHPAVVISSARVALVRFGVGRPVSCSPSAEPNIMTPDMKSSRPTRTMPPPHASRRMTRGLTVGSSGIQGSLAPHDGQLVAFWATGIPQSRQDTIRDGVSSI